MSARLSNGPRAFLGMLGAFAVLVPCLSSGCAGDGGAVATAATPEAGVALGHVITAGGGAAGVADPFGQPLSDDGGDGATSDDGAAASDDGGVTSDDGSSDGAGDDGPDAAASTCVSYTPPACGTTPCDLRTHTCCVTFSLQARCLAGANAKCASNEASIHCQQACECSGGQVCCGVMNKIVGVVQSVCQSVPSGGLCVPNPQTVSQASAQLCTETAECQNGQPCVSQTCIYGANVKVCGLQSQAPFNCVAN